MTRSALTDPRAACPDCSGSDFRSVTVERRVHAECGDCGARWPDVLALFAAPCTPPPRSGWLRRLLRRE